jgi:hypothetical protein
LNGKVAFLVGGTMKKTRTNAPCKTACHNPSGHRTSGLTVEFPLPCDFVAEALACWPHITRFALIVAGYELGCLQSLRQIANVLYYGPRKYGAALPAYADPVLVKLVEGTLDIKRLSIATFVVDELFARHFGTGRLLSGDGEGMGYSHLTPDGKLAAKVVDQLISHWVYLKDSAEASIQSRVRPTSPDLLPGRCRKPGVPTRTHGAGG